MKETSVDGTSIPRGEADLALERAAAVMNEMEFCRTWVCSIFVWVSRFFSSSDGFLDDDLIFWTTATAPTGRGGCSTFLAILGADPTTPPTC